MENLIKPEDISDGIRMSKVFSELSEQNKLMVNVYISALHDKELSEYRCEKDKN